MRGYGHFTNRHPTRLFRSPIHVLTLFWCPFPLSSLPFSVSIRTEDASENECHVTECSSSTPKTTTLFIFSRRIFYSPRIVFRPSFSSSACTHIFLFSTNNLYSSISIPSGDYFGAAKSNLASRKRRSGWSREQTRRRNEEAIASEVTDPQGLLTLVVLVCVLPTRLPESFRSTFFSNQTFRTSIANLSHFPVVRSSGSSDSCDNELYPTSMPSCACILIFQFVSVRKQVPSLQKHLVVHSLSPLTKSLILLFITQFSFSKLFFSPVSEGLSPK